MGAVRFLRPEDSGGVGDNDSEVFVLVVLVFDGVLRGLEDRVLGPASFSSASNSSYSKKTNNNSKKKKNNGNNNKQRTSRNKIKKKKAMKQQKQ